jgi:hypothetical protein
VIVYKNLKYARVLAIALIRYRFDLRLGFEADVLQVCLLRPVSAVGSSICGFRSSRLTATCATKFLVSALFKSVLIGKRLFDHRAVRCVE